MLLKYQAYLTKINEFNQKNWIQIVCQWKRPNISVLFESLAVIESVNRKDFVSIF